MGLVNIKQGGSLALCFVLLGCATSLPWPSEISANATPVTTAPDSLPLDRATLIDSVVGKYAHYDVVAYEDKNAKPVLRTYVISYGFTEFLKQGDDLIERDSFCHADHKMNVKTVTTSFSDAATQAIVPVDQKVDITFVDGQWHLYRPATPTLLGITGNAYQPLSQNINDPAIIDADRDGKPGVTVALVIGGFIKGELYLIRREIFENFFIVQNNREITGYVRDGSEQLVLGASLRILNKPSNPLQHPDPKRSPLVLKRIDNQQMSCDELMARRDEFFPPTPSFF